MQNATSQHKHYVTVRGCRFFKRARAVTRTPWTGCSRAPVLCALNDPADRILKNLALTLNITPLGGFTADSSFAHASTLVNAVSKIGDTPLHKVCLQRTNPNLVLS